MQGTSRVHGPTAAFPDPGSKTLLKNVTSFPSWTLRVVHFTCSFYLRTGNSEPKAASKLGSCFFCLFVSFCFVFICWDSEKSQRRCKCLHGVSTRSTSQQDAQDEG